MVSACGEESPKTKTYSTGLCIVCAEDREGVEPDEVKSNL